MWHRISLRISLGILALLALAGVTQAGCELWGCGGSDPVVYYDMSVVPCDPGPGPHPMPVDDGGSERDDGGLASDDGGARRATTGGVGDDTIHG